MKECTEDRPMNDNSENWLHMDAEETGFETETKVEYFCPHCKAVILGVFRQLKYNLLWDTTKKIVQSVIITLEINVQSVQEKNKKTELVQNQVTDSMSHSADSNQLVLRKIRAVCVDTVTATHNT